MGLSPSARAATSNHTLMGLKISSYDVAAGGSRPLGAE
jgi:hypothetical protein